jgi:glucose/arabinose dehydrogenase
MKNCLPITIGLLATSSTLLGALAEANLEEGTLSHGELNVRNIQLAKNFKLELLHVVPTDQVQGGWVSICADPKGRLFTSSRNGRTFRVTVPPPGATGETRVELVDLDVGRGDGLLWAFDSLYVMSEGRGLYRVQDTNGDDKFDSNDTATLLRRIPFAGDHGVHSVELTPDGKSLFINNGNSTTLTAIDSSRVPRHWGEDTLLPRIPTGFMDTSYAPQGWIAITDPEGKKWELFAAGLRNQYDIKVNNVGELFTWDADMEWDMGDPWYRPTRVYHVLSGADFGFRNGSGKWPEHYIDSWGTMVDIGRGSPTGTTFGYGAKFPKKYQDAHYVLDHQYGKIWAVHLTPSGATYTAEAEPFLSAQPFGAADITINKADGAMYIVLGGRSSASSLWRVSYTGSESTAPTTPDLRFQAQRDLRHKLESFHGHQDPAAVATVWPYLGDQDRALRYAARVALEWQDAAQWREKALTETDPRKSVAAIVALARVSGRDEIHRTESTPAPDSQLRARMLAALDRINYKSIRYAEKLDLLRAYSLVFIRLQRPDEATLKRYVEKFDPLFPAETREENFELSEMLVYLQSPNAATKLMKALREAPSNPHKPRVALLHPQTQGTPLDVLAKQEEQIHLALQLRKLTNGWTLPLREEYFKWFTTTAAGYKGGNTFASSNGGIASDARATLTDAEKTALQPLLDTLPQGRGRRGGGGGGGGAGGQRGAGPGGQAGGQAPGKK